MMDTFLLVNILILIIPVYAVSLQSLEPEVHQGQSVCSFETYEPVCGVDEVVVITFAMYGRMVLGRCISSDSGSLGCGVDVLNKLDKKCSGKRTCDVQIPDPELHSESTCPKDLTQYLLVAHICVKVETSPCQMCPTTSLAEITSQQGYIGGIVLTEDYGTCGTASCPWSIQVATGQNINVTLYDFGRSEHDFPNTCYLNVVILEETVGRTKQLCYGNERESHVYTSSTNKLEIKFMNNDVLENMAQFLLYFEATGCPVLGDIENALIEQNSNVATVRCNYTGQAWHLICKGRNWIGILGTCPAEGKPNDPEARDVYYNLANISDCLMEAQNRMTGGPFEVRIKNLMSDYFIAKARDPAYPRIKRNQALPILQMYLTSCNHLSNEIKLIEEIKEKLGDEDLPVKKEAMMQIIGIDQHILDILISMEKFVTQAKGYVHYGHDDLTANLKWEKVLGFLDPAERRSESSEFHANQTVLYQLGDCVKMAVML